MRRSGEELGRREEQSYRPVVVCHRQPAQIQFLQVFLTCCIHRNMRSPWPLTTKVKSVNLWVTTAQNSLRILTHGHVQWGQRDRDLWPPEWNQFTSNWTFEPNLKTFPLGVLEISCSQEWDIRIRTEPEMGEEVHPSSGPKLKPGEKFNQTLHLSFHPAVMHMLSLSGDASSLGDKTSSKVYPWPWINKVEKTISRHETS